MRFYRIGVGGWYEEMRPGAEGVIRAEVLAGP